MPNDVITNLRIKIDEVEKNLNSLQDDYKKTQKDVKSLEKEQNKSFKSADKGSKVYKKLGASIAAAFTVRAVVNFGKELNSLAVQGEAFQRRAEVVFGSAAGFVEDFARRNSIALGLTQNEFKGAAAAIGDILVPLGLSREAAAELSVEAVKLGTALKRFSGDQRDAAEISQIVARSLTGEVEGLKGLGIIVQQNTKEFKALVQEKLNDGAATESQAKALAIYETVVRSATDATTALENSQDSLQSQQDELGAQWRQLKENLAESLTPALLDVTTRLRETTDVLTDEAIPGWVKFLRVLGFGKEVANGTAESLAGINFVTGEFIDNTNEATKVTENNIEVQEKRIRNIAFLNEEIAKLNKENSSNLDLTKSQNKANVRKIEKLKEELKLLTDLNEKKKESIEFTKAEIKDIPIIEKGKVKLLKLDSSQTEIIDALIAKEIARKDATLGAIDEGLRALGGLLGDSKEAAIAQVLLNNAVTLANAASSVKSTDPITYIALLTAVLGTVGGITAALRNDVESVQTPRFAEGTPFIEGAGTGTSDSIHAMLSRGERVVTAKQNKEYWDELESIRKGKFNQMYVKKDVLLGVAKKHEDSQNQTFADNLANSLILNNNSSDFYDIRKKIGNSNYWLEIIAKGFKQQKKKVR